jgi:hypothetical protein
MNLEHPKRKNKLVIVAHFWTRQEAEDDVDHVYLFGDNIKDAIPDANGRYFIPSSTQAVIRGLPNAIGIPTKKTRGVKADDYFHDTPEDFDLFTLHVDRAIDLAKKSGKSIKMSSEGIGTGAAEAHPESAFRGGTGRFFEYLYKRLGELA